MVCDSLDHFLVKLQLNLIIIIDEQSQRSLNLGSKVTPAKRQKVRQMIKSPTCLFWASPSKISGKEARNDTRELIQNENMDRQRVLLPLHSGASCGLTRSSHT
jgi:hypothetical protein